MFFPVVEELNFPGPVLPCQAVSGSMSLEDSPELGDKYIYQAQHFQWVTSKTSVTTQRLGAEVRVP